MKKVNKVINGKKEGAWETYWSFKILFSRGFYVNGKMEGLWKRHFVNGTVYFSGCYKSGERKGVWKDFSSKGNYIIKYSIFSYLKYKFFI